MQRFWDKVDTTGECWLWTAARNNTNYGVFSLNGKLVLAHRFSYEVVNGPIQNGLVIDHLCHTTLCVNPSHLSACTHSENMWNRKGFQSNSKTKVRGVYWNKQKQKYQAKVRSTHVGFFDELADAERAVIAKRNELSA